ncbi:MAG: hypothetical protein O6761_07980 [Thaumarchaeota archaeon]|nr:hypothetical protein [Nitrososphaerota archaeon]
MTPTRNLALMFVAIASIASAGAYAAIQETQGLPSAQSEGVSMLGHVTLTLVGADGEIKQYVQADNAVMADGKDGLAELTFGTTDCASCTGSTFSNIGIGTGTGSESPTSNTDLTTPLAAGNCNRVAASSISSTGTDTNVVTLSASFSDAASGGDRADANCATGVTEAGLFDSATDATGIMFSSDTFSSVTIGAGDVLTVEWELTFTG